MKVGITLKTNAYTPEAFAYQKFLEKKGWEVQLDYTLDTSNDINIYFMGTRPLWQNNRTKAKEIHEYQSLSTPPYAYLKNLSKRFINKKPNGRIFLNKIVRKDFHFFDNVPYIYRDMGVDESLFQQPNPHPTYDILYCGSINGRVGLIETLNNLAKTYKIAVVGNVNEEEKRLLNNSNIALLGKIRREDLPAIYREARFGLNYTPDIYPFNRQTSTKTLEYLASGLQVISNKYFWAERFFNELGYEPIWLNGNNVSEIVIKSKNVSNIEIMKKFSWSNVLDKSNLDSFLREMMNEVF